METAQQVTATDHHSTQRIVDFVKKVEQIYLLDRPGRTLEERRSAERLNVTMPVQVTPLDNDFKPHSYQTQAVSRDISTLGVGLVMSDPIAPNFVLLKFEPFYLEPFEVICKVSYCTDFGYYFRVGCEFCRPSQSHFSNGPAID